MALVPPPSLVGHLRAGRAVLFVGAGLSASAGLPTWGKLLETLVAEVEAEGDPEEARELSKLLAAGKYLEVADCCKERLGQRFFEVLRPLRGGDGSPPEVQRLALRLPFAAWVTTNYDKLLEAAYVAERGSLPRVLTHQDHASLGTLLFDGAPFLLKAHGDIDRPETVVLTARDFSGLIQGNRPFSALFSALLLTKSILFLGYSLSDPDFRLLLDRQLALFGDQVPDRWAVMSGVGPVERDLLWRTARIKILSYPQGRHEEVLAFLRALETAVAPARGGEAREAGLAAAAERSLEDVLPERGPAPPRRPPREGALESFSVEGSLEEEPALTRGGRDRRRPSAPPPFPEPAPAAASPEALPAPLPPDAVTLGLIQGRSGFNAVLGRRGAPPLAWNDGAPVDRAALPPLLATLGAPAAADRVYGAVGRALADGLHPAVLAALSGLPEGELLVLDLDPELETLPWELLEVGGRPLALARPLVRAPVGVSGAARGYRPLRRPLRALLIGEFQGPGELKGARNEVLGIDALYRQEQAAECTCLFGRQATAESVLAALGEDYDLVHFAGDAWYDAQEVYLALADGVRVTASDLRPLLSRHPPSVLFLNSYYTAFVPPGVSDELAGAALSPSPLGRPGFTTLATRTGVGAFIGCFGSPRDRSAARLAVAIHRGLLQGATIAQAVYQARLEETEPGDPTPLLYILSGASELRMPPMPPMPPG